MTDYNIRMERIEVGFIEVKARSLKEAMKKAETKFRNMSEDDYEDFVGSTDFNDWEVAPEEDQV